MKTFKDFTGNEGIDKVIECAPYINEIIIDTEIMSKIDDMSWLELGGMIIKNHGETFEKLRTALGNDKSENSVGLAYSAAQLMKEILSDKDTLDFFTSFAKTKE